MGIETALIAYGMSAATASAVTTGLITAGVGAVASKVLAPKAPKASTTPAMTQAQRPQEKQQVDQTEILKRNATAATGALSGNASTLLTGSGGVDSGSLNLGTSTLLGQ